MGTLGWGRGTWTLQAPPTVVVLGLLLLGAGVRAQELSEGPVPGQQLLVGAHLRDLAATHDDDDIHLRQVADAVGDQQPRLRAKRRPGESVPARGRGNPPPPRRRSTCRQGKARQKCPKLWVRPFNPPRPGALGRVRHQGRTQSSLLQIPGLGERHQAEWRPMAQKRAGGTPRVGRVQF